MAPAHSKKYFYKDGKKIVLKASKFDLLKIKEKKDDLITSLFDIPSVSSIQIKKDSVLTKIKSNLKTKIKHGHNLSRVRKSVTGVWASLSVIAVFSFLTSLMITPRKAKPQDTTRYAIYSSKPLTIQPVTTTIYSKDSRAQKINEVFKIYNCPLEGMGDVFVYEADRNNIPWWLVAAVSFQESSCGKNTPKVNGIESYNAWGWAVYGDSMFSFDNWARGIETVSKYFRTRFFSQGITDTCEIMRIYTPPSEGSWCEGVNHFSDIIKDFKTESR